MAQNNFSNFLATVRGSHTPRADRFEVVVNFPGALALPPDVARTTSILCEEAQIPGLVATNLPFRIGAWTEYRTQNLEFLGAEAVFTFLADQNWGIRKAFEDWAFLCSDPVSKETAYPEDIYGSITVYSLAVDDSVLAGWKFYETMPKLLSLIPVAASNTSAIRLSITMASTFWERV